MFVGFIASLGCCRCSVYFEQLIIEFLYAVIIGRCGWFLGARDSDSLGLQVIAEDVAEQCAVALLAEFVLDSV